MNTIDEAQEVIKAGARHNRWDRSTLDKMMTALFELGAVCPYCENEGKHGDPESKAKAESTSRASTHIVIPSDHPIAVLHEQVRGKVAEGELAEFGIEDFPHVTIKYGFDDDDLDRVKEIVEQHAPFTVTFGAGSIFSRPDFDVLYIGVESEELRELNAELTPVGDPPDWPGYTPHMTVAYTVPQAAAKYLPIDSFVGMELTVRAIEFSSSENVPTRIELRGNSMPFNGMSYEAAQAYLSNAWDGHARERFASEFSSRDNFYTYMVASWENRIAVYWDGKYYEVPFAAMLENEIVFASRDRWTEVERLEMWVAKHTEYLKSVGAGDSSVTEVEPDEVQEVDDKSTDTEELVKSFMTDEANFLKAVDETDEYWVLANHIVLWGDENTRDAEGKLSDRKNGDGTVGEWFEATTEFDSEYMKAGVLLMDIEHGREVTDRDDVIGFADAKSAVKTDKGLFMKRLLSKRSAYVRWLKEMYEKGIRFATSSEPVQSGVKKAATGLIEEWPLRRDSVTFGPMEPRMVLDANWLQEAKAAIGDDMPQSLYDECVKSGILQVDDSGRNGADTAGADRESVARKRLLAQAAKAQAEIAIAVNN